MKDYILFGVILLLIDIPFIKYVMYKPYLELFKGTLDTNVWYALCAYLIMILSWYLIKGDIFKGALVGFCMYGVYVFTLAAIFPNFVKVVGFVEVLWGTFLFTLATYLTKTILGSNGNT